MLGQTLVCVAIALFASAAAQDANCDYYQNVQAGVTYYINNKNYPNNYSPGDQCRWIIDCPSGSNCRLDCPTIRLPQSQGCTLDRLMVSRTGDPQLAGAETYCGTGSLTATSQQQRMTVGLIASPNSPGGTFQCQVMAQPATPIPGTCRCGYKKTNRIVGGVETGVNEYPMMAALVDAKIYQIVCGCTIIANRYVATAAHCLDPNTLQPATTLVVVGEHDVTVGDSSATRGYRASHFIRHPQYNPTTYDYDVGLVVTTQPIEFSDRVGPVCLPFKFTNTDFTGQYGTFLGWGTDGPGGQLSNVLMKVDVQVISGSQCRRSFPALTSRQMCTYAPGKDACQYDSGGPFLYTDRSTGALFLVAGISYGKFCGNSNPSVNAKYANSEILSWIMRVAPDGNYCQK